MKKSLLTCFGIGGLMISANAQLAFTDASARLSNGLNSGCPITVVDWNNDGMDDIVRLDQGYILVIDEQRPGQNFVTHNFGAVGSGSGWAWGMAVADFDNNGYKDVVAGGYSTSYPLRVLMMNANGTSVTVQNLSPGNFFVQNITLGDFDNDGSTDIFSCDDNAPAHIFLNNGSGTFSASTIINFDITPGQTSGTSNDDSGNYGSVYTDFDNDGDLDLYIAKCRQAVTGPGATSDPRRINIMFRNNGDGTYTEMATSANIAVGWQSWTACFGDVDNDNDFDLVLTNHDHESQLYINDGSGVYTENTTSGITTSGMTPIETLFADFDNDTYIDLLIGGSSNFKFFHNNGDLTFSEVTNLFGSSIIYAPANGDLNHDGFMDLAVSYANIYTSPSSTDDKIWFNNKNSNHFVVVDLKGTTSNIDAIGARVSIYGAWGVQTREVRAGESYGTQNSGFAHFGLGSATSIDSIVIDWPTSGSQTIYDPAPDQFISVIENDCVSPVAASITSSNGSYAFCTGQSVTLSAPAGYTYLWSNGATTQSIVVNATGEFNVLVSAAGNNCGSLSPTVSVTQNPDETPSVSANGPTEFCYGESVVLSGSSHPNGYSWSNGETTQSITVTDAGTYSMTVQGACGNFTSTPITVSVNAATAPTTSDVNIPVPGTANLTATGTTISWYDAASGGNLVGTGNNWTTPFINTTTTYYAEDVATFTGGTATGGKPYVTGANVYSGNTTNAKMYFDVTEACTLNTVKVYTDIAGTRLIQLYSSGGTLLNSASVNIPVDSSDITLNFALTPGTGYYLTTDAITNQAIPGWGNPGPRLKRNSGDVAYPYAVGSSISITGNNQGTTLYYYFYDWHITLPDFDCPGPRSSATVTVGAVGIGELSENGFNVYPNPAKDMLYISSSNGNYSVEMYDVTGRVVYTKTTTSGNSQIDVNEMVPGVYFIRLENASGKSIRKIIVE
ncbi:MAG: FG-GAP-like repeat-containing protein [Flavobacteriales bacterium]|nr:FG-GAP-like repeat-containing protein [Flavobacteriales bacterium]